MKKLLLIFIFVLFSNFCHAQATTGESVEKLNADNRVFTAIRNNDLQTAAELIKAGADVNNKSEAGSTPLMEIVNKCYSLDETLEVIQLLFDHGADIEAKDVYGRSALLIAVDMPEQPPMIMKKFADVWDTCSAHQMTSIVELLLSNGANMGVQSGFGTCSHDFFEIRVNRLGQNVAVQPCKKTAFLHAAASGNIAMAELFHSKGADINATDEGGRTALMYAARYFGNRNQKEIVKFLLANGAHVNAVDSYDMTALKYAQERGDQTEVIQMLKAAGATETNKGDRSLKFLHLMDPRFRGDDMLILKGMIL